MKRAVLWLAALAVVWSAWGQVTSPATPVDEQAIAQSRARIELERQEQTNLLAAEDSACLSRFAVTRCQNEVAQRRRVMLSRLKRQEIALNDVVRRQRARDQMQRIQEKSHDGALRRAESASLPLADDPQKRRDEKVPNRPQVASSDARAATAKVVTPVDAKALEENRKAYQEKLKSVEARRQERDKRLLEKGPAKAALPLPP